MTPAEELKRRLEAIVDRASSLQTVTEREELSAA